MAEPARNLEEDADPQASSGSGLRSLPGGGESGGPPSSRNNIHGVDNDSTEAEHANTLPEVDRPNIHPNLGEIPGEEKRDDSVPGGNLQDAERDGGYYNPEGDSKRVSPSGLRNREESGAGSSNSSNTKEEGENQQGRFGQAYGKYQNQNARGQLSKLRSLKNKWIIGIGAGSVGMFALIIIALVLIAGAYKVVDFAEHVAAYQFARTTSMAAVSATNIDNEATSLFSISSDSTLGKIVAPFANAKGQAADLLSEFDQFRPNKILSIFQEKNVMNFNYDTTRTGRSYIKSVTINGVTEDFDLGDQSIAQSLKDNLIPGYKFYNDVNFARDFSPTMTDVLEGANIGVITRFKFAALIREKLDISLLAWLTANGVNAYAGLSQKAADAKLDREAAGVADGQSLAQIKANGDVPETGTPSTDPNTPAVDKNAATVAASDETAGEKSDDGTLAEANNINSGDLAGPNAEADVAKVLSANDLAASVSTVLKVLNPVYGIAMPMCLIWDGSIVNSKETMDSNSAQTERTGMLVQSASAQFKDGYTAGGEVDGAWDYKLGNINDSYAEEVADGQPLNTSGYQSTESAPNGQYSYNLGDYLGPTVGGILGSVGSTICPTLTSLWVAGGLTAASLVPLTIGSGGISGILDGISNTFADSSMKEVVKLIGSKIRSTATNSVDFATDLARTGALIGGATLIAREMVSQEVGDTHSGLATDQSYDNDAFCGTNIYANQIDQQQYYGAPLVDSELPADNANSQAQFVYQNSQKSTFDRYLAVTNPDSLLSHLAITASGYTNSSAFSALMRLGGSLLNPVSSLGMAIRPMFASSALAATPVTSANTYCGNVQFGYTQHEKNLLDECPADTHNPNLCSYQPLENQLVLDNSGVEDQIATYYGKCFDGSESIGDMLANGDIQRDQSGNVIANAGLCSPDNLGPDNTDPNSPCGSSGCGDLVFRYRIANMYNNTMGQLLCEQDVSTNSTCESPPSASTATPAPATGN